jgi:CheY-like chemotaxis protein
MRILFVENHRTFADTVIREFLGGHVVTVVRSCADAMSPSLSDAFDAILVDYDLDDGKGEHVVRGMRARGFAGPIVAVSAHEEGNAALVSAGATAACPKARFREVPGLLARLVPESDTDGAVPSAPPPFRSGDLVAGTVFSVMPFGFFVDLGHQIYGLVRIVDVTDYPPVTPGSLPVPGTSVTCVVLEVQEAESGTRVALSVRESDICAARARGTPPLTE